MKLFIDLPACEYKKIISDIPHNELEYAVKNGSIIPDNSTNGDVIKVIFPNVEIFEENPVKTIWGRSESETKWWKSSYKADKEGN